MEKIKEFFVWIAMVVTMLLITPIIPVAWLLTAPCVMAWIYFGVTVLITLFFVGLVYALGKMAEYENMYNEYGYEN